MHINLIIIMIIFFIIKIFIIFQCSAPIFAIVLLLWECFIKHPSIRLHFTTWYQQMYTLLNPATRQSWHSVGLHLLSCLSTSHKMISFYKDCPILNYIQKYVTAGIYSFRFSHLLRHNFIIKMQIFWFILFFPYTDGIYIFAIEGKFFLLKRKTVYNRYLIN